MNCSFAFSQPSRFAINRRAAKFMMPLPGNSAAPTPLRFARSFPRGTPWMCSAAGAPKRVEGASRPSPSTLVRASALGALPPEGARPWRSVESEGA